LFNYGIRHRKGLPISSSIAESAVNQFVSHRMVNKQQMRWTNEGAYCMGQVRGAVLNGGFSPRRISALKIADLASRQMHRFSISRRAPANEQNRPCDHVVRQRGLTKSTSPSFARCLLRKGRCSVLESLLVRR
jgi:hypothetical protein